MTFERCPAVCFDEKLDDLVGFDIEIMQELEFRLNFTATPIFLKGFQAWGRYVNNTLSGALSLLKTKTADIGIGNYYLKANRLSILDSTISYYSVPIVVVIPPG